MLLQVAIDRPEHLRVAPLVRGLADIVEIGTPLLKRFGIGVIATVHELCPGTPVLADTKTVDGGDVEAEMVLGAGARLMTVLSSASSATHLAVDRIAARFGAFVVVDTITESGKPNSCRQARLFQTASPMSAYIHQLTCGSLARVRPTISKPSPRYIAAVIALRWRADWGRRRSTLFLRPSLRLSSSAAR